jgi:hypothetical protein
MALIKYLKNGGCHGKAVHNRKIARREISAQITSINQLINFAQAATKNEGRVHRRAHCHIRV